MMNNMNSMNFRMINNSNILNNISLNKCSSSESNPQKSSNYNNCDNFNGLDLNKKDEIMRIIDSQDFINGFWEINEITEIIKEKYKKEFDLLKGIKNNKIIINDKVAMTILIIYFINKEHPELLDELSFILIKAKNFISKEAKESYENIIKEIGIN